MTGTLKIAYLTANFGSQGAVREALVDIAEAGCSVKIGSIDNGLLSTTWFNIEITGPDHALKAFQRWVREMMS